jgi:hypothetical protein
MTGRIDSAPLFLALYSESLLILVVSLGESMLVYQFDIPSFSAEK